jgi:ATP-dependent Clp protease ATP-binding subunit ClpB
MRKNDPKNAGSRTGRQNLCVEYHNPQIEPEHLLWALLDQEEGLIPQLLRKQGVAVENFKDQLKASLFKLPRTMGGGDGKDIHSAESDGF